MMLAPPISQTPAAADATPSAAAAVCAKGLCKTIDDRPILRNLDLAIPTGQFIALLGANGAGKSTLLKILSTLLAPTAGTLELFGLSARRDAASIRARIGLIGHQSMLYGDLSPLENLVFFGRLYNVETPRDRALHLLTLLGLKDRAEDPVKSFSRGMAQRVSIARALMHDPAILLADEPFAGLDAPSTAVLERVLRNLHDAGKTILLANHDIAQSLRLAQRAVILKNGEKIIDAPADTLDADHILFRMERDGA
ncbi:MAG TPA: ABC transporter ATP-binding protein [Phycisphaerae bacterium]|nr:ABC transporter ATP-binding protein [Phycisphaerae bacterium]